MSEPNSHAIILSRRSHRMTYQLVKIFNKITDITSGPVLYINEGIMFMGSTMGQLPLAVAYDGPTNTGTDGAKYTDAILDGYYVLVTVQKTQAKLRKVIGGTYDRLQRGWEQLLDGTMCEMTHSVTTDLSVYYIGGLLQMCFAVQKHLQDASIERLIDSHKIVEAATAAKTLTTYPCRDISIQYSADKKDYPCILVMHRLMILLRTFPAEKGGSTKIESMLPSSVEQAPEVA